MNQTRRRAGAGILQAQIRCIRETQVAAPSRKMTSLLNGGNQEPHLLKLGDIALTILPCPATLPREMTQEADGPWLRRRFDQVRHGVMAELPPTRAPKMLSVLLPTTKVRPVRHGRRAVLHAVGEIVAGTLSQRIESLRTGQLRNRLTNSPLS